MDHLDAGLVSEFVVESQEGLANIERQMLAIEAGGAEVDLDLVNSVFRTMHTIKGTSGFLGLDRIGALAHGLEEVLNAMRNRELATSSELVTTILHSADFMKSLIDCVETSNEADITQYVASLQRLRATNGPSVTAPVAAPSKPIMAAPAAMPTAVAQDAATTETSKATLTFVDECFKNLDQMDRDLCALDQDPVNATLAPRIFRTMHTIKGGAGFLDFGSLELLAATAEELLAKLRDGKVALTDNISLSLFETIDKCREGLLILRATGSGSLDFDPAVAIKNLKNAQRQSLGETLAENEPDVEKKLPLGELLVLRGQTAPEDIAAALAAQKTGDTRPMGEILVQRGAAKTEDVVAALKSQETRGGPTSEGNIRVDVGLLDKLMTRVGELVLARNQIVQYTSRLDDPSFVRTAQRLNLITTELQESVMKTRMQPIGNVWGRFPRVVRDLSSQLGKQIRIELEGQDTELDKTIVEAIKDPLTHLVRNSVDHGIETPEVRVAAGKPAEGVLLLRAYHEGGQVNIEITDDGGGLNLERIRKKAIERGLLSADQAARMSDRDASQLIFSPGFSTAEKVTSVSGRGVGMDVVKTNIEQISGTIDLQSRLGHGTTIKIKIPLTLAIIPALVITNDGDRYAIPQVSLLELLRLDGADAQQKIERFQGAPVFRLRGKLLPLVYLSERLGISQPKTETSQGGSSEAANIVVLRANDRQFGLVVDKINDTEEIVVKPLSRQLKGLQEFAGATIMGDGAIALILDVMGLAVSAGLVGEMRDQQRVGSSGADKLDAEPIEALLVVDLGDSRRFALPTSMISRLEKVATSNIEYADGREVIQYRGAIMPLVRLSEVFGSEHDESEVAEELQIVVYAEDGYRCGLVVRRIVDIVETQLQPSTRSADDNLLGTAVIQQRVTDVLNLRRLARRRTTSKFSALASQS